jgi:hypothetical protein
MVQADHNIQQLDNEPPGALMRQNGIPGDDENNVRMMSYREYVIYMRNKMIDLGMADYLHLVPHHDNIPENAPFPEGGNPFYNRFGLL